MWTGRVSVAFGLAVLLGLSGWAVGGEADAPKEKTAVKQAEPAAKKKTVDPYRSVIGKLNAARRKLIQSKPELADAYKQFLERRRQLEKELAEFYAKLRTMSPEIDALEKKKEELAAERRRKQEEARAARRKRKTKEKK